MDVHLLGTDRHRHRRDRHRHHRAVAAALIVPLLAACLEPHVLPLPDPLYLPAPHAEPPPGSAILVGAGDIGDCRSRADEATARLLDAIPGTVFTTGDNVYPKGRVEDFAECFEPSWGRHKDRIRPAPGNHDYRDRGASAYFAYFGDAAGDAATGYYSYDLGAWHVVVLNTEVAMHPGSAQERWLVADLAAHPVQCTVAYMHEPRFSSSFHGRSGAVQPLWDALYAAGAEVVIAGHDHVYERFAPLTPGGEPDSARGIRQFVVGTGGARLYRWWRDLPHSEARYNRVHGVLKLTLHPGWYEWEFVPVVEGAFEDHGEGRCH